MELNLEFRRSKRTVVREEGKEKGRRTPREAHRTTASPRKPPSGAVSVSGEGAGEEAAGPALLSPRALGRRNATHGSGEHSVYSDGEGAATLRSSDSPSRGCFPLLAQGTYPTLRIEQGEENPVGISCLNIKEDIYKMHFMDRKHFNWVGSKAKGEGLNKEYEVYSVLYYPIKTNPVTFMALRTSKRGTEQFYLNVEDSCVVLFDRIYHALRNKEPDTEFQYIPETRKFSNDLVELERKHPQKITEMKIGVIYCKPGQTKPQEMFQNGRDSLCPSFWTWINTMGKEINLEQWNMYKGDMGSTGKTYYKNWEFEYNNKKQNIEIIYHLAPLLEPEGHRRLIGNDVAVIFFMEEGPRSDLDVSDREEPTNAKEEEEEGESFKSNSHFKLDPMVVSLLGTVPQVFIAIQPYRGKYRVQFFSYTNIKPHLPPPPTHPISTTQMVDLVLTKIYNGLMSSRFCVPMNRLFFVPRGQTLQEDILEKYLSNNLTTKKKKKEETRVLIIDEPKKKKMECVRVTVVSVCIETMDQSYDLTVILTLGENQQKTKTIKHSNKPIWNEDYTFDLCGIDKEFTEFEVDVYCHRNCGTIGLVRIPVFDLLYLGGQLEDQPQWFTLMRRSLDDSTTEGSILLKFALTDEEVVLTEPKTPRSFRKSSILPSIKPKVPNL